MSPDRRIARTNDIGLRREPQPPMPMVMPDDAELDLRIAPGPRFGVDGTFERYLRMPYVLPVPQVREAVARLAGARHLVERPTRRWSEPAVVA
ncbi:hypothetical protein GCM10009557_73070 [Virgisporangium ochraceum]